MTTPLELAQKKRKEMLDAGVKPVLNPILKADNNPKSKTLAIHATCFQCYGGSREDLGISKEIRDGIRDCTSVDYCALHPHRKYKQVVISWKSTM